MVKLNSSGPEVKALQKLLVAAGYSITVDGIFGLATETAVKDFQAKHGLEVDGVVGPATLAALSGGKPVPVPVPTPVPSGDYFGAKWIGVDMAYVGKDETDAKLNALLVPEWKNEGLNFKTLAGNSHPWCSVLVNDSFRKVGIKPTNSAGAASWRKWGRSCPYWFGSVLGIQHVGGTDHVTFFLYWVDEAKKLAACYGGNQSNHLSIAQYTISGNAHGHDEVINGPRWPKDAPDGQALTKAQVLAKYPNLKVGAVGGSTV